MKRKGTVLLAIVSAAVLLSALTACGSGESEPAAVQESQSVEVSSAAEEDTGIVRTNFTSGVLVEGGEDEVSFEVKRMELAEEGFVIEYAVTLPSHGYTSYGELSGLTINGCSLTPSYYDSENQQRSDLNGSVRAVVDRATMDRLNITELKSVKFELQAGYLAYSSITMKDKWDVALYPGEQDDSAFTYTPSDTAQMLLDEAQYQVALTDVEWLPEKCGQILYLFNGGTVAKGSGDRIDLSRLVVDGQEMHISYDQYYMWTNADPCIIVARWTYQKDGKSQSTDELDLTKAELTLRIGADKSEEDQQEVTIPLDLSYPDAGFYRQS